MVVVLWIDEGKVNRVALDHGESAGRERVDFFAVQNAALGEILLEEREH